MDARWNFDFVAGYTPGLPPARQQYFPPKSPVNELSRKPVKSSPLLQVKAQAIHNFSKILFRNIRNQQMHEL